MITEFTKKTYKPYTFVGTTVTGPVLDPIAVLHLDIQILDLDYML